MKPSKQTSSNTGKDVRNAVNTAISATDRGDYKGALQLFRLLEKDGEIPVRALSYYGLCVVKVERQTKQALEMAERSHTEEFFESRHWANLVRIYLAGGSRRRAVTVLEEGLEQMPGDSALLKVRNEMGYRARSPVPFLHRDHFLNVYFGKRRHLLHPSKTIKIVIGIIWFLMLIGATLYFLMQNSGF